MIDYVAKGVRELGLKPGAMVGVRTSRPYRDLCCRLALARVGIAVAARALPIHNITACLTDEAIPEAGRGKFVRIESVWSEDIPATREITEVASHPDGSAIFSVFATSGTTGRPKYVAMSHDLMAWRIATDVFAAEKSAPVRLICSIGPGTSYGFRSRLVALQNGGTVIMTVRVEGMLHAIIQHRVSHLTMAPFSLDRMVRALPADTAPPPSLKQIEVGGSALPARVYEVARKRLCANIVSRYGAMETGFVASGPLAILRERPGAVGFIDSRVEVEAVDADDHPLPIGSEGTLRMRSPGCAREYVGNPEASTQVFRGGWVYPGDVGMVASDRMLIVTSRASEVINQGGIKINPQVIERRALVGGRDRRGRSVRRTRRDGHHADLGSDRAEGTGGHGRPQRAVPRASARQRADRLPAVDRASAQRKRQGAARAIASARERVARVTPFRTALRRTPATRGSLAFGRRRAHLVAHRFRGKPTGKRGLLHVAIRDAEVDPLERFCVASRPAVDRRHPRGERGDDELLALGEHPPLAQAGSASKPSCGPRASSAS